MFSRPKRAAAATLEPAFCWLAFNVFKNKRRANRAPFAFVNRDISGANAAKNHSE
jgi:hypothetical protein